jgi:hypothetical protein
MTGKSSIELKNLPHGKSMNNYFRTSISGRIKHMVTHHCAYSLWSALVALIFCAGCATDSTPPFNYAPDDQNNAAKDFSVPPGKSVIYVIDDDHFGKRNILQLQVDQKDVCRLSGGTFRTGGTFYRMVLDPGSHQLALRYSGEWSNSGGPIRIGKELIVTMESGYTYFFHGKVTKDANIGEFSTTTTMKIEFKQDTWQDMGRGRQSIREGLLHLTGEVDEEVNPKH